MYIEGIDRDWFSTYNFKGEFEKELKEANAYVRWTNIMSFFKDLITAFAIIGYSYYSYACNCSYGD